MPAEVHSRAITGAVAGGGGGGGGGTLNEWLRKPWTL